MKIINNFFWQHYHQYIHRIKCVIMHEKTYMHKNANDTMNM